MASRVTRRAVVTSSLLAALPRKSRAAPVVIEYWQYYFKERVTAMDALIGGFEAANPGIAVRHITFPYAQYRTKISAAVPAGEGPDVLQLYYGWLRDFRRAKLIAPLPTDLFPPDAIDKEFTPIIRQMRADGAYHALPTAVRSMGLFTNRARMREAGLDPATPPATLDSFLDAARRIARSDAAGNLLVAGTTIGLPSQDSHWWREVLVRQFGGTPFSDDYRQVRYGSDAGAEALRWYADLQLKHKVAAAGFMTEAAPAFRGGHVGLLINGSFLMGAVQATKGLDFAVAELPAHNNIRANYASYWANALVDRPASPKREAAARFLAFITTADAMARWAAATGELPARADATTPAALAPFSRGLAYASATDFVDEDAQRAVFSDMLDRVLLKGQSPAASVREAAAAEQKIIDDYYKG